MRGPIVARVALLLVAGCGRVGYEPRIASGQLDAGRDAPEMAQGDAGRHVCGDGVASGTEQCDDGNATAGDGCEADCTWSCMADEGCDDTQVCNGTETCDTGTHACLAGTPAADGTACDGMECRAGACAPIGCGDGTVTGSEECDDANTTNGDGCDNDCTFTCAVDSDCSDGDVCNGTESCNTASHTCSAGTSPPDGTPCPGGTCVGGSCQVGGGTDAGTLDGGSDGGVLSIPCSSDRDCFGSCSYCRYPTGACRGPGSCATSCVSCTLGGGTGSEVCGCNGVTYSTSCYLTQARQSVRHTGPCAE